LGKKHTIDIHCQDKLLMSVNQISRKDGSELLGGGRRYDDQENVVKEGEGDEASFKGVESSKGG
jgi:hypothetical protein